MAVRVRVGRRLSRWIVTSQSQPNHVLHRSWKNRASVLDVKGESRGPISQLSSQQKKKVVVNSCLIVTGIDENKTELDGIVRLVFQKRSIFLDTK
jgi:hypothetical protein